MNENRATKPEDVFGDKSCDEIINQAGNNAGVIQGVQRKDNSQIWLPLFLLSIFLGNLGIDRFYVGKIGTGILKLITFGGFGIWWLIDCIMILTGRFTDKDGNFIKRC
jgi:TM2 domain-containing membrane protein YozV